MIDITSLLPITRIGCRGTISSKKKALETLSQLLATPTIDDVSEQMIFESLIKRERLGSTGLGNGIAMPHGRIAEISSPRAAVLTLKPGIDFDAIDGNDVEIVFALAIPEDANEEHLQILAYLAEMFSDPFLSNALRNASSADEIHRLLSKWRPHAESA